MELSKRDLGKIEENLQHLAVKRFTKASIDVLKTNYHEENNIRCILEFYETASGMKGPAEEMMLLLEGFHQIKYIIIEKSQDGIYDGGVVDKIQSNFEEYFIEDRFPGNVDKEEFFDYIQEKKEALLMEIELSEAGQKSIRRICHG